MDGMVLLIVVIAGGLFLLWIVLYFIPIGLWFQALVSDVKYLFSVGIERWRKVPPSVIREGYDRREKSRLGTLSGFIGSTLFSGRPCGTSCTRVGFSF